MEGATATALLVAGGKEGLSALQVNKAHYYVQDEGVLFTNYCRKMFTVFKFT